MTIQHVAIADADRHEPKGIDAAGAGTAYVSTGAATGTWVKVQKAQAACLRGSSAAATTLITTAYQVINNATLGGTIAWVENTNEALTTSVVNGYIQVTEAGIYQVIFCGSFLPASAGGDYYWTIGVDSGAGIVSKEASIISRVSTSGTSDSNMVMFTCLPTLLAGDKVYVMVKEVGGKELTLYSANFNITRVA